MVVVEVALPRQLGDPVGGDRELRVVLGCRESALLTVYGPAGGGEDNPPHVVLDAALKEAYRSKDVDFGVEVRLPNRPSNVHLGCLVAERIRLEVLEDLGTPGADVLLVESRALRDVLAMAAGEVIDNGHLMAVLQKAVGYVRADKAGAPGQQH